jgi:hypothetical protein
MKRSSASLMGCFYFDLFFLLSYFSSLYVRGVCGVSRVTDDLFRTDSELRCVHRFSYISPVRYETASGTLQNGTLQNGTMHYSTVRYSTARYSTYVTHSTLQNDKSYNTVKLQYIKVTTR